MEELILKLKEEIITLLNLVGLTIRNGAGS
jgi:hypothetical protein